MGDDTRRLPVLADLESGALYVEAETYAVPPQETVMRFLDQVSPDDLEERALEHQHLGIGKSFLQALKEIAQ